MPPLLRRQVRTQGQYGNIHRLLAFTTRYGVDHRLWFVMVVIEVWFCRSQSGGRGL